MNILVVDDNDMNRKLLRVNLEAEGHTVLEAADGIEALQRLERELVDAVISDVLMPRMDGYRLCHELRRHPKFNPLPFIVFSSTYTSAADEKLAWDLGVDAFIKRPGPIKSILAAIQQVTSSARTPPASPANATRELSVLKEYSEALVRKLETTQEQLIRTNGRLEARTEELEQSKEALRNAHETLEARVNQRTAQLEEANKELESFSYSVSHDLYAPLRAIDGFATLLLKDCGPQLSDTGQRYARLICQNARRMGQLIDDVLAFSRLSRKPLQKQPVNMLLLVQEVTEDVRQTQRERAIEITIGALPDCQADPSLLRQALTNLVSNAFKFTRGLNPATIEIGSRTENDMCVFFVRDNGVGFDMAYAGKLFGVFQRLHSNEQFEGNGIGLSIAHRIIQRHGGRIWAESQVNQGATFHFSL